MSRVTSLTEQDLSKLSSLFFHLDNPPRQFTIKERTNIFHSIYYFRRSFPSEVFTTGALSKLQSEIKTSFLNYYTSFTHEEWTEVTRIVMFLEDKEISDYSMRTVDRMIYVLDQQYALKLNLTKKIEAVQFYPRILHTLKDKDEIFNREKEKIKGFMMSNFDEIIKVNVSPELIVCTLSNYSTYVEVDEELYEVFIPYLYRNLATFNTDLSIELFFSFLNFDFDKFKNPNLAIKLVNTIFQNLKNLKTNKIEIFEKIKEAVYFLSIRKDLEKSYEAWKAKNQNILTSHDHTDYYHMKIFNQFMRMSLDTYPFSALKYNDELFDRLFSNLKRHLQF